MYRLRTVATRQDWPVAIGVLTGCLGSVRRSSAEKQQDDDEKNKSEFDLTKHWTNGPAFFKEFVFSGDHSENSVKENSEGDIEKGSAGEYQHKGKKHSNTLTFQELLSNAFSADYDAGGQTERKASELPSKDQNNDFASNWFGMASDFGDLLTGNSKTKEQAVNDLIVKARESIHSGDVQESQSFSEILSIMETDMEHVRYSLDSSFAGLEVGHLFPTSLFYYLEHEDQVKNPSWKRRMHRFFSGIDIRKVTFLNDQLYLASLAYADTIDDVKQGLRDAAEELELVYCETEGHPGKPAYFVALKKNQSIWNSELEVVIAVRGTKTFTDIMTDCLLDSAPYQGGKAHNGILTSGKYIAKKTLPLLQKLRKIAKKRSVKLTLVGHSLGAGAASIAGMELQKNRNLSVQVVGFGCPSLLSEDLSKSTSSYITTVIADDDIVPRMSAATVGNVLLDIMEYDWTHLAKRDIEHSLNELRRVSPGLLSDATVQSILDGVQNMLITYVQPNIKKPTSERKEVELFPPGACIHIYRDGNGVSGAIAPCTFFGDILISRRMIDDHLTESGYKNIFLDLMRQYHSDYHYTFDEANID